ncbi:hypothetical protein LEP1GSC127_0728 [Leptospira kirschneri str. 200801925]|nr:hypothetical protein LEP1GSC127_0728 [Leptospira kirschneri str. 200801925]
MILKFSLYVLIFICLAVCSNQNDSDLFWLEWGRLRKVETHFSFPGRFVPTFKKRNVKDKILKLIENSQFSIDLWIYSFDDLEILEALKNANARRGYNSNTCRSRKRIFYRIKKFGVV